MPTTTSTLTRTTPEGVRIPVPGRYELEPNHSEIGFVARHLVVTKVRGRFSRYEVDVQIAEDISDSTLEVRIDAASITTGNADRDAHLRSPDFFDVERFNELVFRSTGIRHASGDTWLVDGTLEIVGVARPVTLEVEFGGEIVDPWGNTRLLATATTEIDREAWGLTWNQLLEAGGVAVSKKIRIEIEAQALPVA